ncbi:MAG: hypothetical protein V4582_21090 [Pseudomonadota bacterium]
MLKKIYSLGRIMALAVAFGIAGAGCGGGGAAPVVPPIVPSNPAAPAITAQPANATVAVGASANFSVSASGDGPITYQWQRDGVDLPGATAASYTIAAAALSDNGSSWRVVVRNGTGSVSSAQASLTIKGMTVKLVAGAPGGTGSADGLGAAARFRTPTSVALDAAGNLYVTDTGNSVIRKISPAGVVRTLAGSPGVKGAADGLGRAARFNLPEGIALDAAGNVYVSDTGNHTVRKITPAGLVSTLAGSAGQSGFDDGVGAAARFYEPSGIGVDAAGVIYVGDGHSRIRKITPDGAVSVLAGQALSWGYADGVGTGAIFSSASGLQLDVAGNVYVIDNVFALDGTRVVIRKVTPAGVVATVPGSGNMVLPNGISVDGAGNIYASDVNLIRKLDTSGTVRTIAGGDVLYVNGLPIDNALDGPAAVARFAAPRGLAVDRAGNVFIADTAGTIRKLSAAGVVTTVAGEVHQGLVADASTTLYRLRGAAADAAGNVYVVGSTGPYNIISQEVYRIATNGQASHVTTLAAPTVGIGTQNYAAESYYQGAVALDASGNVYLADSFDHVIAKVDSAGIVTRLAGSRGQSGAQDGQGAAARLDTPGAIAVDAAGAIYVADTGNRTIRKVSPSGLVTTLAGSPGDAGWPPEAVDGAGASARFVNPASIAVDAQGNIYVGDGNAVRKISPAGVVSTFAGNTVASGSVDGAGAAARFNGIRSLAVDASGRVLVADRLNHTIRAITPAGVVSTLVGSPDVEGVQTGNPGALSLPSSIMVGANGVLYVSTFSTVLKLEP